jgi:hypothetical protein
VLKAMRSDPELRYASAASLREDLALYLEGRRPGAREGWSFSRAGSTVERYLLPVTTAAAATLRRIITYARPASR